MTLTTSIRRPCTIAVVAAVCLGAPVVSTAAPITIATTNVWRADRTPNPINFLPTALVPWVSVTNAPDNSLTDVQATVNGNVYDLTRIINGVLAGIYFAQIPYDPALDGPWTITASNDGDAAPSTVRPAFVPVDAMPFLSSISFTGTGTDITVHWTVSPEGEARDDEQNLSIWDITNPLAPVTVQFFSLGVAARSVDLTPLPLIEGRLYAVEINSVDRNARTGYIDAFSGTWLNGWTPTDGEVRLPPSVPEPASLMLLATGLAGAVVARRRRRSGQN